LPLWMQLPAEYQAPVSLAEHCFVRETAKAKLKQLRQLNAKAAAEQNSAAPDTQSGKAVTKKRDTKKGNRD